MILVVIFFYTPNITPESNLENFKLSKNKRLKIGKKLKEECSFSDAILLAINYRDILGDKNAAKCWSKYANKCIKQKENNLSLKIAIDCPIY